MAPVGPDTHDDEVLILGPEWQRDNGRVQVEQMLIDSVVVPDDGNVAQIHMGQANMVRVSVGLDWALVELLHRRVGSGFEMRRSVTETIVDALLIGGVILVVEVPIWREMILRGVAVEDDLGVGVLGGDSCALGGQLRLLDDVGRQTAIDGLAGAVVQDEAEEEKGKNEKAAQRREVDHFASPSLHCVDGSCVLRLKVPGRRHAPKRRMDGIELKYLASTWQDRRMGDLGVRRQSSCANMSIASRNDKGSGAGELKLDCDYTMIWKVTMVDFLAGLLNAESVRAEQALEVGGVCVRAIHGSRLLFGSTQPF